MTKKWVVKYQYLSPGNNTRGDWMEKATIGAFLEYQNAEKALIAISRTESFRGGKIELCETEDDL